MVVGIIGGGASGMAAAISAAHNPDTQVLLLERQARVGRKLQATGNGRCNLTNLHASQGGYHGEQKGFSDYAISQYPPEETLAWFQKLGLLTVAEASGRVYPYSDQANSVVDVLRFALEKPNIRVMTGVEVRRVKKFSEGFLLETDQGQLCCERLIVACGGLAGSKLRPALVQIKTDWPGITGLKGVRANCHAAIYRENKLFARSQGEIQFTEQGLSGPVIFEISRDVCREKGKWLCILDLLPQVSQEKLEQLLGMRRDTGLPNGDILTGILHNRLGRVIVQSCGLTLTGAASELKDNEIREVAQAVKGFRVSLTEPLGMDSAQVTAGGICTEEFDPMTMESRLVPGLYACGEVLDVDGDCGGYNLQWAWSSGRLAGNHAGGVRNA